MRAEHDSRQALVRALHMADDIAKRILAQFHARLTHQPHQICAPLPVRIRERQPVDSPPRRRDFFQSSELLLQALFGNHDYTSHGLMYSYCIPIYLAIFIARLSRVY